MILQSTRKFIANRLSKYFTSHRWSRQWLEPASAHVRTAAVTFRGVLLRYRIASGAICIVMRQPARLKTGFRASGKGGTTRERGKVTAVVDSAEPNSRTRDRQAPDGASAKRGRVG